MLAKIVLYFTPPARRDVPETFRQHKLIVITILLTAVFDLNYSAVTVAIKLIEGTYIMIFACVVHIAILFLARTTLSMIWLTNIYILIGVAAIDSCIFFSGGFTSPVLPWLASSPIVALLMAGRSSGILWMTVNAITIIGFGYLATTDFQCPIRYDMNWHIWFSINCSCGLVVIIFLVSLVFENGKRTALSKLAEKSLLLAEEKKKTAIEKISQEIHDSVGQNLSIVKMNLHLVEMVRDKESDSRFKESLTLLSEAIANLRHISNCNFEETLNKIGFIDTLRSEINKLSKFGQYVTSFNIVGEIVALNSHVEFIISRIVKEAINNIVKHAKATLVDLTITYQNGHCTVIIHDNGIGMSTVTSNHAGFGLKSMLSRTDFVGGDFLIDSAPGKGTKVMIRVPIAQVSNSDIYPS